MDEKKIFEACFRLSEELMWEKNTAPIDRLTEHLTELSYMTETFIKIIKSHFYQVESLPDAQEIILGAISYLTSIAIPPLKGNFEWFNYSLAMLLEIANPNDSVDAKGLPFLFRMRNGVERLITWANSPDDE
jgi:hypothetical protein